MAKIFYFDEVVKFAIEKEIESFNLYKNLSEKASDPTIKKLFSYLMEQEKAHKNFFNTMLASVKIDHTTSTKNDEYQAYVQELIAESRVIAPFSSLNYNDLNNVFDYAIGREKDSIVFYTALKNVIDASSHVHLDEIIREEGSHIMKILEIKNLMHII